MKLTLSVYSTANIMLYKVGWLSCSVLLSYNA